MASSTCMSFIGSVMSLVREVCGDKSTRPLVQFIRYGIVGASATVVHLIVFNLVSYFVLPAIDENLGDQVRSQRGMINNTIAFLVSNTYCYLLNAKFIFLPGRHSKWVEFGLFFAVSGISFVVGTGLFGFLIRQFGVATNLAQVAYILASVSLNYVCRRFIVFKS